MADSHPKTVLITGAGFSLSFGHPLTRGLFQSMWDLFHDAPGVEFPDSDINYYMKFLGELKRTRDYGRVIDMEKILTRIREVMLLEDQGHQFPHLDDGDFDRPGWNTRYNYGWPQEFGLDPYLLDEGGYPRSHYGITTTMIARVLLQTEGSNVDDYVNSLKSEGLVPISGIITTNYDLLPERLLDERTIDYGFPDGSLELVEAVAIRREMVGHYEHPYEIETTMSADVATSPSSKLRDFPVLKIHGSLNQLFCRDCEKVLHFPSPWIHQNPADESAKDLRWLAGDLARRHGARHVGHTSDVGRGIDNGPLRPLMVPPVRNKEALSEEWPFLKKVHARALELAASFDKAVIIGSNIRPEDDQLEAILRQLKDKDVVLISPDMDAYERLINLSIPFKTIRHVASPWPLVTERSER